MTSSGMILIDFEKTIHTELMDVAHLRPRGHQQALASFLQTSEALHLHSVHLGRLPAVDVLDLGGRGEAVHAGSKHTRGLSVSVETRDVIHLNDDYLISLIVHASSNEAQPTVTNYCMS